MMVIADTHVARTAPLRPARADQVTGSTAADLQSMHLVVQAGMQAAAQLAAQHAEAVQQFAASNATRAPLPDRAPSPEAAAEALLAADAMLAANPNMPAARLAHVEVRPAPGI